MIGQALCHINIHSKMADLEYSEIHCRWWWNVTDKCTRCCLTISGLFSFQFLAFQASLGWVARLLPDLVHNCTAATQKQRTVCRNLPQSVTDNDINNSLHSYHIYDAIYNWIAVGFLALLPPRSGVLISLETQCSHAQLLVRNSMPTISLAHPSIIWLL